MPALAMSLLLAGPGKDGEGSGDFAIFPYFGDPFKLTRAQLRERGLRLSRFVCCSLSRLGSFLLGNCLSFRN